MNNFNDLKATIEDHLNRDDLGNRIEDFIKLAEARHARDLRFNKMLVRFNLVVNNNSVYTQIPIPELFLEAKRLRLLNSPFRTLTQVTPTEMDRVRREGVGIPRFFALEDTIEFDIIPSEDVEAEMLMYARFQPLSEQNLTNELLQDHPDAYLYAALVASAPFLMDDERIQIWADLYAVAKESINSVDKRGRNFGPVAARVAGPTP